MAAARILSWLPVRLVRRSSISNMAFPLGACSFLSGRRAYAPTMPRKLPCRRDERKPVDTRGTCAKIRTARSVAPGGTEPLQIAAIDMFACDESRERLAYAGLDRTRSDRTILFNVSR